MATYARADLIREALSNLGIVNLPDTGVPHARSELVSNAAVGLGVLAAGQTLDAESYATIDSHVNPVVADLNSRAIVTINPSAIPDGMFNALSDILASASCGHFEITGEATIQLQKDAQTAERRLYNFGGSTVVDRNLDAILAELSSDEIVSVVDVTDIPQEWFLSLAAIVADRVKGKFPLIGPDVIQRAKAEGAEAMQTLRRTTRGRPSYNRQIPEWF